MLIDKINLNYFRVFESVYRQKSTISAAEELHLTQSGISQHLKSFEGQLGQNLFDRINRSLVPTPFARSLYEQCHHGLLCFEKALKELLDEKTSPSLRGILSIGFPTEFGHNCVLEAIAQFAQLHPTLKIEIFYGLAYEMNHQLLTGQLDFAFVDNLAMSPQIITIPVYEEALSLFASKKYLLKIKKQNKKNNSNFESLEDFESLEYIDYLPKALILKMWFKHHFKAFPANLNVRATISEVRGVSKLIFSHLGAGILPEHHANLVDPKGIFLHRFKNRNNILKNKISIASLIDRTHSPAALASVEYISDFLKRIN